MALGKLPVKGCPTIWMRVEQGHIALATGAGGGCLDIFTLLYPFSPHSPSLRETVRYRLKYCLKGSFNPKQPTNQLKRTPVMQCIPTQAHNVLSALIRCLHIESVSARCFFDVQRCCGVRWALMTLNQHWFCILCNRKVNVHRSDYIPV